MSEMLDVNEQTDMQTPNDDFRSAVAVKLAPGVDAIPVYDVVSQQNRAAEFCSHYAVDTLNATDVLAPQRLFPQARRRHRAVVASRTLLTGEQNEYVLLGSMAEVMNNRGMKLWNGQTLVFESSPELWIASGTNPPTHTISVSVIDERYE